MKFYLYNSKANNGIKPSVLDEIEFIDAVDMDYPKFFEKLTKEDEVVLVGGDGTLNYFINAMNGIPVKNNVYLLSAGTGNDFFNDIGEKAGTEVLVNKYFEKLPTVRVNGFERQYVNNMGFGIDGYCCEVADRIKAKTPDKKINYTAIAIKGLLGDFKPCHAQVTVDGKKYEYDNVWLAPTMKGRFYGGGMMIAPSQDRFSDKLTVVIYHEKSKLKSLMRFPSIFKGEHVKFNKMVEVITGNKVHVEFSRPCAAQIDGETVLNVTEYDAWL